MAARKPRLTQKETYFNSKVQVHDREPFIEEQVLYGWEPRGTPEEVYASLVSLQDGWDKILVRSSETWDEDYGAGYRSDVYGCRKLTVEEREVWDGIQAKKKEIRRIDREAKAKADAERAAAILERERKEYARLRDKFGEENG